MALQYAQRFLAHTDPAAYGAAKESGAAGRLRSFVCAVVQIDEATGESRLAVGGPDSCAVLSHCAEDSAQPQIDEVLHGFVVRHIPNQRALPFGLRHSYGMDPRHDLFRP